MAILFDRKSAKPANISHGGKSIKTKLAAPYYFLEYSLQFDCEVM